HHERVKLDASVTSQEAAAASVEGLVVFHGDNRGLHRIQGFAAALQHVPAFGQRLFNALQMRINYVIGHGPGSAVNHHYRKLSQKLGTRSEKVKQSSVSGKKPSAISSHNDRVIR